MSLLNTGLNAIGTLATLKGVFGGSSPPQGTGKLNQFHAALRERGVGRTNLFDVSIAIPPILRGVEFSLIGPAISLWAEGAQLPGYNIQTDSIKRYGIGPQESVPYSIQTNDITINMIGDGHGGIQKYFYEWLHRIVRGDNDVRSAEPSVTNLMPYEVEFKNQYATTITITQYNEQGIPVIQYELIDAFPKNIPDISLSWTDGGQYMQFGVTFSYLQAKLITQGREALVNNKNGFSGLSAFQKALKVGTALQTLKTIRRPTGVQDALASASTIKNVTGAFSG
jgi:hypothetical protein